MLNRWVPNIFKENSTDLTIGKERYGENKRVKMMKAISWKAMF